MHLLLPKPARLFDALGLPIESRQEMPSTPSSPPSRQQRRHALRQAARTALRQFEFSPAHPDQKIPRQRRLRRMLAAEAAKAAFKLGDDTVEVQLR